MSVFSKFGACLLSLIAHVADGSAVSHSGGTPSVAPVGTADTAGTGFNPALPFNASGLIGNSAVQTVISDIEKAIEEKIAGSATDFEAAKEKLTEDVTSEVLAALDNKIADLVNNAVAKLTSSSSTSGTTTTTSSIH